MKRKGKLCTAQNLIQIIAIDTGVENLDKQ
jgi:hypothetical protein